MKKKMKNEFGEQVVTMTLDDIEPLTEKDILMIKAAKKKPVVYDEDCPPMTDEMLNQMKEEIKERKDIQKLKRIKAAML